MTAVQATSSFRQRLSTLLPWIIGTGLLLYVLAPYRAPGPRAELLAAFSRAPSWAIFVGMAGALVAYLADTLATWFVLREGGVRIRMGEVGVIRGVTYFLAVVHYHLGQAAMIFALSRAGQRVLRATGLVLFMMGINMLVLLLLASLSLLFGAPSPPALRTGMLAVAALVPVYFILLIYPPAKLRNREVFAPLFELGWRGHVSALIVRLPHVISMMFAHWAMMRSFGIQTPALAAALYLPIVFAVTILPISTQGIGTSQLVLVQCFSRFAVGSPETQRATVLAYSLYLLAMWIPTQLLIGMLCMRTEFGRALKARQASLASRTAKNSAEASSAPNIASAER